MSEVGRILVAMSGGVDSSVAAALLREAGHDLVGVTLHLWDAAGEQKVGRCCAPEDRDDARRTCEHLGIPHYVLDEREAFRTQVVDPFVEEYRRGRTPVPCVHCNRTVKLVQLAELAQRFGATHVATGHYAKVVREGSRHRLLQGRDRDKDQSYFLFGLPPETLGRLLFPLGDLVKDRTREEGRRLGVPNADKPDSQELCFVPDGDVAGFVREATGEGRPGRLIDTAGQELGRHDDIAGFTVGQRRGIGLGGGPPRYVLRIVADSGDVVVGTRDELASPGLEARDVSWIGEPPGGPFEARVRVRYRHAPAEATVTPTPSGFRVAFRTPQPAVAPGQAAVVYRDDEVLGGGFIQSPA